MQHLRGRIAKSDVPRTYVPTHPALCLGTSVPRQKKHALMGGGRYRNTSAKVVGVLFHPMAKTPQFQFQCQGPGSGSETVHCAHEIE